MRCLVCKSERMEESTNTYFAQLENCYVIIENVSCFKCLQCGEGIYPMSVMETIDEILGKVDNVTSKIFIVDYSKAA